MSDVKFIQGCQVHSVKLVVLPRSCSCKYGHYLCFIYFYLPLLRSKDNLKISSIQRTAILDSWLVLYKLLADLLLISCHANYSRIYSGVNIGLMIGFVWFFSFGMMVPPLAEVWGKLGLDEQTFSCTILK